MSGTASPSILVPISECVGYLCGRGLVTRKCTPRKTGTALEPCWNLLLLSWKNWINLFSALANLRHVFIFKRNFGLTILPNHGKRHFFLNILWHPKIGVGTCKHNMFFHAGAPQRVIFSLTKFQTLQTCHQIWTPQIVMVAPVTTFWHSLSTHHFLQGCRCYCLNLADQKPLQTTMFLFEHGEGCLNFLFG